MDHGIEPRTREDLERLLRDRVPEGLHLEYKAPAVLSNGKETAALTRSVSAMANADGGVIIIGMRTVNSLPSELQAVPAAACTKERLEDLLNNVRPRVPGLDVVAIEHGANAAFYVIVVPPSHGTPHQASDYVYYRRHQTKCLPMHDFEIADVRRRSAAPGARVVIDLSIRGGFLLDLVVANRGTAIAESVRVEFEPPIAWGAEPPFALTRPLRALAPGRELAFLYGSAPEVFNGDGSRPKRLVARVAYRDALDGAERAESFELDAEDYLGSQNRRTDTQDLTRQLKDSLGKVTDLLGRIERRLEAQAPLADATGLSLSVTTLRNLAALLGRETSHVRLPTDVDASVFREVLGVELELSYRLERHFRYGRRTGEKLLDVEGMTPALVEALHEHFDVSPNPSLGASASHHPAEDQAASLDG